MAYKIILFNHKGGVSKTTTTFNIGWKLAELGKRILLVDADPQCNLTSYIIGEEFDKYYIDDATKEENIKNGVQVAFEGKPQPIEPINAFNHPSNENLFLIPGHPNLSEYDPSLSLAQNSNNAISTLQNLPGAINELIERVVDFNNIDIVFIDLNPGLSAINQNLFIISDAFIIPANPDPFSIMALKTLKEILPRWKKWARTARELFSEATYKIPQTENLFLGVIVQRFNIRNGKPAKPYQDNIGEIKRYAKNELEEVFDNHSMLFDNNFYNKNKINDDYCLLEISEFGALLQKAHKYNKPVYALTDEQLEVTGPVLEQMKSNRQKFDKQFYNLANIVIESIEYENG